MASTEKPKRVIDRERQWRKVDTSHYRSPKGRFEAARDAEVGWVLVDTTGELPTEFFQRWKDARGYVESIEFAAPAPSPIVFETDEIRDEFHDVYRVVLIRDGERLGHVVSTRGHVAMYRPDGEAPMPIDEAEAFATALMVAVHNTTTEGR
jgi:hypothetical protein